MFISFIIPVYNAENYLNQTILSVLNEGHQNLEVILVDDGSTDESVNICKEHSRSNPDKIFLYQHPNAVNKGVSASRTLAISKAKGDLLYFLDADDQIIPGTISRYIEMFSSDQGIILIHGLIKVVAETTPHINLEKVFDLGCKNRKYFLYNEPYFLETNPICNSTVCVRRSALSGIEFQFNQAFQIEDWVLWTLLSQRGYFYYLSIPVVNYRYHPSSATYNSGKKGFVFHTYTKIELYMALLSRVKDRNIKSIISKKLYEHLGMLHRFYSNEEGGTFAGSIINTTFLKDCLKSLFKIK